MAERRIVLVTASTRGIGKVMARAFAEDGATLGLNYLSNRQQAEQTLGEIREVSPESRAFQADVSGAEGAKGLIREVEGHFGRIDILVNNAGPMLIKGLYETTPEEWDWMIQSNLSSVFYCSRYALEGMRQRKEGQIVNIGCLHGEIAPGGLPNSPAYGVAKSAVLMLTRLLARSEAKNNIRVNAINPGLIETDDYANHSESERQKWAARVPQKIFGQPRDIAEAALFLTSDRAAYITRAVLPVHGGLWIPES
jgi:NAD(P)-dependent dehydrogenase (short-subunit alcohol dehydrogenase family)